MNCPECDMFNLPGSLKCDCGYEFPSHLRKTRTSRKPLFDMLNRVMVVLFVLSLAIFLVTQFYLPPLPEKAAVLPQIYDPPVQTAESVPEPFSVKKKGMRYRVEPLYQYELKGLVVSTHDAESLSDVLHETWKDYLNVMDICVIWGPNIETEVYRRIKFTSGNFTCFCRWFDDETGRIFRMDALSNNHLLTDDRRIERRVRGVRPGDQIAFSGYLAKYENPAYGFSRGTSTNRTDGGDGACETVYLTEFEVLQRHEPLRPWLRMGSIAGMLICVAAFLGLPFLIQH